MKKLEVIAHIAKKTGVSRGDVKLTIETLIDTIIEKNAAGEKVHFRGFGKFEPRKQGSKAARNISENTLLILPERYSPRFLPSRNFVVKVREALQSKLR